MVLFVAVLGIGWDAGNLQSALAVFIVRRQRCRRPTSGGNDAALALQTSMR